MSNSSLVLFCSTYPSKEGEHFLHNEMSFVREDFNDVIVITENQKIKECETTENIYNYQSERLVFSDFMCLENIPFIKEILFHLFTFSWLKFKVSLKSFFGGLSYMKYTLALVNQLNLNLDKTVFYTYWFNDSTIGLSMLKRHRDIKFVTRVHRWDLYEEENLGNYLPFRKPVLLNINQVFSISEHGLKYLHRRYKFSSNILSLSRLGVSNFGGEFINENDSEQYILVSCSHVKKVKRVAEIAKALGKIKDIQIKWIHFGGGEDLDEVKRIVKEENSSNIEVSLPGSADNSSVLEFYHTNRVSGFINFSSSEGLPVSIMEAMEAGIPVLATNVGGVSEIVKDSINGRLIEPDISTIELQKEIYNFLTKRDLNSMSKKSREIYLNEFNDESNYKSFIDSLKTI